jgi:hypothetical protein
LWGGDGDDTILGLGDIDSIQGGAGNDWIDGGSGQDKLHGGDGNDTVYGGNSQDIIFGGEGDDYLVGYNPDGAMDNREDLLIGAGNDTLIAIMIADTQPEGDVFFHAHRRVGGDSSHRQRHKHHVSYDQTGIRDLSSITVPSLRELARQAGRTQTGAQIDPDRAPDPWHTLIDRSTSCTSP